MHVQKLQLPVWAIWIIVQLIYLLIPKLNKKKLPGADNTEQQPTSARTTC